MKSQMIWNLKWHEISPDMKSQKTWNLKRHEISNDMKSQMTWNVKSHKISNVFNCKMSWNVKCHLMLILMLDLWPQEETPGVTHFGAITPYDHPRMQLFEHTPVLHNNLNINAMMTLVTMITIKTEITKTKSAASAA